jgi:hypothetical protein
MVYEGWFLCAHIRDQQCANAQEGTEEHAPPVTAIYGRMPELGLLEPIRVVLILCALADVCAMPNTQDEIDKFFVAGKQSFHVSLKQAASRVVSVVGGIIGWNSLFRASQSQEIRLQASTHHSAKVQNLAESNLHSVTVLYKWYGWGKHLFSVRPFLAERS